MEGEQRLTHRLGRTLVCAATLILPAAAATPGIGSSQSPELLDGPDCASCRVHIELIARLGDFDGPGMLEAEYHNVVRDSRGRLFLTSFKPYFWVFDASGAVVRRVGRNGRGPGEFLSAGLIAIDASDSVFVFDSDQGRAAVYSAELEFVRTVQFGIFATGTPRFAGGDLVVNARVLSDPYRGRPIHILDRDGAHVRSFPAPAAGLSRAETGAVQFYQRKMAHGSDSSIWMAEQNQYRLELWSLSGERLRVLHRRVAWFPPWDQPEGDAFTEPVTALASLAREGDLLWVLNLVAGPSWQDAVEPSGRLYRVTDRDAYRNALIEAVSLSDGNVLASTRFPFALDGLLPGGLVYRSRLDDIGNPSVEVFQLSVAR